MNQIKKITIVKMTIKDLYQSLADDGENGQKAVTLLGQTHWFTVNAEFDPRSGAALPQSLSAFLNKVSSQEEVSVLHDRIWRIADHARESLRHLFSSLNENPSREQALMPIRNVRELDANSFIKLSNRPGRNIREKLAGKPYLQAVRHFQSVDLPENRLLKEFSIRLAELLEMKANSLGTQEDPLVQIIRNWLHSDEAESISRWDNTPPNNTLLSHRDYRRIWDAWRWMQTLDDDIDNDFSKLPQRQELMEKWIIFGQMYSKMTYRFAEMPVFFNYDKFTITTWTKDDPLFLSSKQIIERPQLPQEIKLPVCIDLTELHPSFGSINDGKARKLSTPFLWQHWERTGDSENICLFNADAVYLHSDTITISIPDLFFSKNHSNEYLDLAAHAFSVELHETFKNSYLLWLSPDFLNDFELEITRRNLNSCFPNAEPLPRSVAAVFEKIDYGKITNGYTVLVVDSIGKVECATKLEAHFDEELKKRVPETRGFYWERHPPVILNDGRDANDNTQIDYDIFVVDDRGVWKDKRNNTPIINIKSPKIAEDERIGNYTNLITISGSPVYGGIRFLILQKKARDITLWCDQVPELSIKAMVNGRYKRFYLVSRGTTIKPIRGHAVKIPISETFMIPQGKESFPLFIGENEEELGFSAKLESPDLPLKESVTCHLNMTFTYGADNPYNLLFVPTQNTYRPIHVVWTKTIEEIITDAPSPEYPKAITWEELMHFSKPGQEGSSDLLEWISSGIEQLDRKIYYIPHKRIIGRITSFWHIDKKGLHYTFVSSMEDNSSIFIHESCFLDGYAYTDFSEGDYISFELQEYGGKFSGRKVAGEGYKERRELKDFDEGSIRNVVSFIHKSLFFPTIQIWRDGRSLSDSSCPANFKNDMRKKLKYLESLLSLKTLPDKIKKELLCLLAFTHADCPEPCVQWLEDNISDSKIDNKQAVGFSLGCVSDFWQQNLLLKLTNNKDNDALRVFSYSIWRERDFVNKFSFSEYKSILVRLLAMLSKIKKYSPRKDDNDRRRIIYWTRSIVEPLELLLGLLRTRASMDYETKMLLQPHQRLTKDFAKQVERITDLILEAGSNMFSRVQLGNLPPKPVGDNTPDLLYALRLYLTGDNGANAIQITGFSEDDDE